MIVKVDVTKNVLDKSVSVKNVTIVRVMVGHVRNGITHRMSTCARSDLDNVVVEFGIGSCQRVMFVRGSNVVLIGRALQRSHPMRERRENSAAHEVHLRKNVQDVVKILMKKDLKEGAKDLVPALNSQE